MSSEIVEKPIIDLEASKKTMLTNLKKFEKQQKQLVKENPFIEIVDKETYELAKKHRTALVKGRTGFNAQEKTLKSVLNGVKNLASEVINETLIPISKPHEDKQQTEVKRWEAILEEKREEKAKIERERIEKINNKIEEIKTSLNSVIESIIFANIVKKQAEFKTVLSDGVKDFDFEEFEIELDEVVSDKEKELSKKTSETKTAESKRLEELSNLQEAKINTLFRQVSLVITNAKQSEIETLSSTVEDKLDVDFDFGSHAEKWEETKEILTGQAKEKVSSLKSSKKISDENETRNQENAQRSNLLKEQSERLKSLLGMTVENYEDVSLNFESYEPEMKTVFDKIPAEFESMMSLLKSTQETKLAEVKKALKVIQDEKKSITDDRVSTLVNIHGLELNEETGVVSGFGVEVEKENLADISKEDMVDLFEKISTNKTANIEQQKKQERLSKDFENINKKANEIIEFASIGDWNLTNEESIKFVQVFNSELTDFIKDKLDELKNL